MQMDLDLAILYLTGKANKTERSQFEKWIKESADNFQEFDEFKESWIASGKAYEHYTPNVQKAWNEIKEETILKTPIVSINKSATRNWLKIAASVAIVIGLSISVKLIYNWSQTEEMVTFSSANSIISISLSDNSKVWLNSNSEITVPKEFKGNKRKILLKGGAFFEVTKNPKKPFVITAHQTITKVLGTSFYINAPEGDSAVALSVVTGKVSFTDERNPANNTILLPGQTGTIDHTKGLLTKASYKDQNFLAWKTGKMQFNKAPLEEVCKVISSYYKIEINPGLLKNSKNISFSGSFDNKPLLEVLSVIELTLGVKFEKKDNVLEVQLKD
jgi:ferric-dicitrate binding protein FerR (iron transport regulator)